MKDRFFYPLALVVIAAIIALAFLPGQRASGPDQAQITADGFVLSGNDLMALYASNGTNFTFVEAQGSIPAYGVLSTNLPRNMAPPSAGVFGTLSSDYEQAFAGQKLLVTVTAKQDPDNPLDEFEAGYFSSGAGDSGWRTFTLGPKYQDFTFTFTPGAVQGPAARDYIGVWPGKEGKKRRMLVKTISVKISD